MYNALCLLKDEGKHQICRALCQLPSAEEPNQSKSMDEQLRELCQRHLNNLLTKAQDVEPQHKKVEAGFLQSELF